ncbi:MAG: hypothetical protein WDZ73_01370 [Candidatus Paceibacterota bacterium]
MEYKYKNQSGFVILYAVIVASVVSLSGILLGNIIVKQIILSSIGRESQFAYYAANVANECIKNGLRRDFFGFYIDDIFFPAEGSDFLCDLNILSENDLADGGGKKFEIEINTSNNTCTEAELIIKQPVNDFSEELVVARGYNICDEDHPRRVEKVIYRDNSDI